MARKDGTKFPKKSRASERKKRFAENLAGAGGPETIGNATKAAEAAGYSKRSAHSTGHELRKDPEVKKHLQEIEGKTRSAAIASIRECQEVYTLVLRDDPSLADRHVTPTGELVIDPEKLTPELLDYYREHEAWPPGADVYFKPRATRGDRLGAATALLKAKGALIDQVDVKVGNGFMAVTKRMHKHMTPAEIVRFSELVAIVNAEIAAEKSTG